MGFTSRYKFKVVLPLLFAGLFIFGSLTTSSIAAEGRVGFVNIQQAVSTTKEWKSSFSKFKLEFTKEKNKIKIREKKITKMLKDLNKQGFVLDPELKRKKEEQVRKAKVDFEGMFRIRMQSLVKEKKK